MFRTPAAAAAAAAAEVVAVVVEEVIVRPLVVGLAAALAVAGTAESSIFPQTSRCFSPLAQVWRWRLKRSPLLWPLQMTWPSRRLIYAPVELVARAAEPVTEPGALGRPPFTVGVACA